ncbi:MAG: PKD domain-containing protein [Candidatus Levybacteria bacterium]|nr:PKD domain-containing protein [Candidatus Levybacteria bacterium]
MNFLSGKKFLLLGFIVVLLVAIPLTILTLQKSQETRSRATPATTLSFSPTTVSTTAGQSFNLDVNIDPGSNQVSFVKLSISYDQSKLSTGSGSCNDSFCPTNKFPSVLEGPIYTPGNISITLSVGADPTAVIQAATKIATVTFKANQLTSATTATVSFDTATEKTQVLSIAQSDTPSENVLLPNPAPATINIAAGAPLPTAAPTTAPTPTSTSSANQPPVCSNLNVDRTTSGVAPFSITFTVNGTDANGTIKKVTIDFGDGPVQDISQNGGIGSKDVSLQIAHTYRNPGTFKAQATLTDNNDVVSAANTSCAQTITVTQASAGAGGQANPTPTAAIVTDAPIVSTSTPQPTLAPPGPDGKIIGIGAIGAVLAIIGGLLFFAL